MTSTVELIKQLRQESGAGVLDCRLALEQASNDYTQALSILREQAAAEAARRAERPAAQGLLEVYSHGAGRIAVIVEVCTETDFAARAPAVRAFAHEVALHIAAAAPAYVRDEEIPAEVLAEQADKAAALARSAGKPEAIIPRIVEGTLAKFKERSVLLRQTSIRDESVTIATLLNQAIAAAGENIIINRFVRWERA